MRTLGTILAAAALAASAHAQSTGNLLGNPGFETNLLITWGAGWSDFATSDGVWAREGGAIVTAENGVSPAEGVRMLRMTNGFGLYTQAMQPVDVGSGLAENLIATGSAQATFTARFNLESDPGTQPRAYAGIHFYGAPWPAPPLVPHSYAELLVDGDPGTWQLAAHELDVPATTRWIVVEVMFHNGSLGTLTRGYVDDTSLVVSVPSACVTYCDANGVDATPCPCGNDNDGSAPDGLAAGCKNSLPNWTGGMLRCAGVASLILGSPSGGGLGLVASNVPPGFPGLFFQADNALNAGLGLPFGDGLRCASGNVLRLQTVFIASDGTATSTVDIPALGMLTPGSKRYYQFWHRDNPSPCSGSINSNLTNGVEITWLP